MDILYISQTIFFILASLVLVFSIAFFTISVYMQVKFFRRISLMMDRIKNFIKLIF